MRAVLPLLQHNLNTGQTHTPPMSTILAVAFCSLVGLQVFMAGIATAEVHCTTGSTVPGNCIMAVPFDTASVSSLQRMRTVFFQGKCRPDTFSTSAQWKVRSFAISVWNHFKPRSTCELLADHLQRREQVGTHSCFVFIHGTSPCLHPRSFTCPAFTRQACLTLPVSLQHRELQS